MVMFSIDEQSQEDKLKEIVQSTRIPGNEGDILWLHDLSPNDFGRAFNNCILDECFIFLFTNFIGDLVFYFPNFFSKGLEYPWAFFAGALDLAFYAFDPADGCSEIYSHEYMLLITNEGNGVADIFFITDLTILSILVQCSLIFADNWLVLIVLALIRAADERKLKVAACWEVDDQ